jgi:hypothetical protein
MYDNLLNKISNEAKKSFDAILATYNFEHGNEFEVALCKLLKLILPKKYSICRGYIVTSDGQKVGDDLIIYNAETFPKIRPIEDDFCIKQYIPVEAVYAYIEAKHTLCIDGNEQQNTLQKAMKQISDFKALKRIQRPLNVINGFTLSSSFFSIQAEESWPEYRNPLFGMIFSRHFKSIRNDVVEDEYLSECLDKISDPSNNSADLIIAGENWIGLPCVEKTIRSPFLIPEKSKRAWFKNENSIGIGICNLLRALNFIELGEINYSALIAEGLDIPFIKN